MTEDGRHVLVLETSSVEHTVRLGVNLARALGAPAWIALDGELGAGKTQLVRGLVEGLGGDAGRVHSPTFVLVNVYETPGGSIWHADAYRLGPGCDLRELSLPDPPGTDLVVVEWARNAAFGVPDDAISVHIDLLGETSRRITVSVPQSRAGVLSLLQQAQQQQEHDRTDRGHDQ